MQCNGKYGMSTMGLHKREVLFKKEKEERRKRGKRGIRRRKEHGKGGNKPKGVYKDIDSQP